jgi:hypothetical protein
MLRRVRGTLAGLAFGSTVAAGMVFGTVCSVDRAGLSNGDASTSFGGSSGGSSSSGGRGGAAGSGAPGTGGTSPLATGGDGGGQTGGAGGRAPATGGAPGTGGNDGATGGSVGTGGAPATGGATGTGGTPATGGATGTGGTPATGGDNGATGGAPATGGDNGATGGAPATGGTTGTGGSHPPSCSSFPKGSMFVTPTDNLPHCYWTHSDGTDWDSSEASCVSDGGTLATILSSQENMFVLSVLTQPNLFMGNGVSIGATDGRASSDKSGAGTYAWVTGEPWSYQNWHMDHPDGACTCQGSAACTCNHWLVMFNDGTWWDRPDKAARPYICEAIAR